MDFKWKQPAPSFCFEAKRKKFEGFGEKRWFEKGNEKWITVKKIGLHIYF